MITNARSSEICENLLSIRFIKCLNIKISLLLYIFFSIKNILDIKKTNRKELYLNLKKNSQTIPVFLPVTIEYPPF